MNQYENFELDDFVCDDSFISWCLEPDDASDRFWDNWIASHPAKRALIREAKQLVFDLHTIQSEEPEFDYQKDIWKKISSNIEDQKPNVKKNPQRIRYAIAASLLILVCLSAFLVGTHFFKKTSYFSKSEWINFQNNTSVANTIVLSDNSTIVLEPYSTLKYPTTFSGNQRVVVLKGEAFFNISRDTLKPFVVYANETITKVLGTSFKISAFEGEEKVEVDVISGKVAVYANVSTNKTKQNSKHMIVEADENITVSLPNKKIEVTPNQKVIFDLKREDMIKTITEVPKIINQSNTIRQFQFNNESVVKVFAALEDAYGIELLFDKQKFSDCTITTKLDNESLLQKLTIICTALNLSFKETNAQIYIDGKGCER
jgi:transmembrane sensor